MVGKAWEKRALFGSTERLRHFERYQVDRSARRVTLGSRKWVKACFMMLILGLSVLVIPYGNLGYAEGKVNVEKFSLLDEKGAAVKCFLVGSRVLIESPITNPQTKKQPFAYIVQIKDDTGVNISLSWLTGELFSSQTFKAAQSWIPEEKGDYTIEVFVWESVSNPRPIGPPYKDTIVVVDSCPTQIRSSESDIVYKDGQFTARFGLPKWVQLDDDTFVPIQMKTEGTETIVKSGLASGTYNKEIVNLGSENNPVSESWLLKNAGSEVKMDWLETNTYCDGKLIRGSNDQRCDKSATVIQIFETTPNIGRVEIKNDFREGLPAASEFRLKATKGEYTVEQHWNNISADIIEMDTIETDLGRLKTTELMKNCMDLGGSKPTETSCKVPKESESGQHLSYVAFRSSEQKSALVIANQLEKEFANLISVTIGSEEEEGVNAKFEYGPYTGNIVIDPPFFTDQPSISMGQQASTGNPTVCTDSVNTGNTNTKKILPGSGDIGPRLQKTNAYSNNNCFRIYMQFDISLIPVGADVGDTILEYYINQAPLGGARDCTYNAYGELLPNDLPPADESHEENYDDEKMPAPMASAFATDSSCTSAVGSWVTVDLGPDADLDIETKRINGKDWFAVGMKFTSDPSRDGSRHQIYIDTATNKPLLTACGPDVCT